MGPRYAIGYWLVVAIVLWLDSRPTVHVVRADFGGTAAIVISLISSIASWFGRGGGSSAALERSLRGLRDAIAGVAGQLVNFIRAAGQMFARIAGALRRFWREIVRPFLVKIDKWIRRAFKWLRDTFGPLLEFLRKLRRKILEFYNKWFRPIFDTIDAVRRVLGLLGRFGVDWARELDAKLAELEEQMLRPIRFVMQKVNEIIDLVDRVITVDGLLQRYTLVRSLILHQKDALNIWWQSIHKALSGEERAEFERPLETRGVDGAVADYRAYVVDGSGPDAARIDEHALDYAIRLRRIGGLT